MDGKEGHFVPGPEGYVGLRAPKGSVYEGGVLLLATTPTLKVITPIHHPTVFNPVGKTFHDLMTTMGYSLQETWGTFFPQGNKARANACHALGKGDEYELSFREGAIITLTKKTRDTWYMGECRGMMGLFPGHLVTILVAETLEGRVQELYAVLADEKKMTDFNTGYLPSSWYRPWEQKVEEEKQKAAKLADIHLRGQWSPRVHHLCCPDFKREVILWLLILKRWNVGEKDVAVKHFPSEIGLEVIRQLSLLHHPIVTINERTGELQGVQAVLARYQIYRSRLVKHFTVHAWRQTASEFT